MPSCLARRVVAATTVWVFPFSAHAAAVDGVYVAPIAIEGASEGHIVSALEASVRDGLADANVPTVAPPDGCDEPGCMAAAATEGKARGVVAASVAVTGSDYRLAVEIRDGGGAMLASGDDTCEICTYEEASTKLRGLVASTAGKIAPGPDPTPAAGTGRITISSSPAGATVIIDGATVGTTPYDAELAAGAHEIELQKAGHQAEQRDIDLAAGSEAKLDVALSPKAGVMSPRTTEIIGWSALGVGVASLGAGIALLVLDDNPVKSNCSGIHVDSDGDCEFRYDTLNGGVALTVLGVAGIATGTGLVVYVRRNRQRQPAQVAIGLPALRGRF